MSKKIYCIIISIILILSFFLPVYAASATVNFNTNTTSLKVGETFTITLSVKCPEGLTSPTKTSAMAFPASIPGKKDINIIVFSFFSISFNSITEPTFKTMTTLSKYFIKALFT